MPRSIAFVAPSVPEVRLLADSELMAAQRATAEARRQVDAVAAMLAAEIAERSRRDLGYEGLAQKLGARTPEKLVQQLTGATARESQTMVRVGTLIGVDSPLAAVGVAVSDGTLSLDAADAIRAGLQSVDPSVSADDVAGAAEVLLGEAATLNVEQLARRAREVVAALDESHIVDREQHLRDQRSLTLFPQSDGMTRLIALLDPESAATISAAYDAALSPRRGGPRFVDPEAASRAEDLVRDARTDAQVALDTFVELVRLGEAVDPGAVLPSRQPAVQVIISERDLERGAGAGALEGQTVALSTDTVQRHICQAGAVPVLFDTDGQIMNVGRERRLFTRRQRIGLAARDGGCRFPGCDRPPSWCEAHHIDEWHRDRGRTDVADGVLLCRYHHLLMHNNGWKVERTGADYAVVPPRLVDPAQHPIPLPAKSAPVQRLLVG